MIHNRLQAAAGLDGHSLYIECHHPSARLTAANLFCTSLGTDGLDDLSLSIQDEESYVGQIKRVGGLYSRFRPQRKESGANTSQRHPAGDVPGSRTHPSSSDSNNANRDVDEAVSETVTVDAHELFSQLSTFAYLGKREPTRGLLFSIQDVSEGMIRVWRDWLARQCERKTWTDGEPVVTHHDSASGSQNRGPDDGSGGLKDPTKDPSILWLNTRDDNVGIKFKVKERKWMRANPIMYSSEVEVPASYEVEFEGKHCFVTFKEVFEANVCHIRGSRPNNPFVVEDRGSRDKTVDNPNRQSDRIWCLPEVVCNVEHGFTIFSSEKTGQEGLI